MTEKEIKDRGRTCPDCGKDDLVEKVQLDTDMIIDICGTCGFKRDIKPLSAKTQVIYCRRQ